jgi:hypothetical protein
MSLQTVQSEILTKLYKNMPINDIASAIEPLRRTAHRVYSVILLILSLLAVFIFVLGAISWRNLNTGGFVHRGLSVCFFFVIVTTVFWPFVQYNKYLSSKIFPGGRLLSELREAFGTLAVQDAFMTARGEVIDRRIFDSCLSPLFMSSNIEDLKLIRTPLNRYYVHTLFVVPFPKGDFQSNITLAGVVPAASNFAAIQKTDVGEQNARTNSDGRKIQSTAGTSSKHVERIRNLGLNREEMLRRIALLNPPRADGRREAIIKLALSTALPILLKGNERGALSNALARAGEAVRNKFGMAGTTTDSTDWIRKMIAPAKPWLIDQLSKPPEQSEFSLTNGPLP